MLNLLKIKSSIVRMGLRSIQTSQSRLSQEKNVAIVLSGCGVYDGSEIVEATSCAIQLLKNHAQISFFAPNVDQMHVVNHLTGEIQPDTRNVLQESARIARGKISALDTLRACDFDAIVFPGGFGAAKNLSNFATHDTNMEVNKDVERVVRDFVEGKKPIGFVCIAPIIAAKLLPGVQITLGLEEKSNLWPYSGSAVSAKLLGAKTVPKDIFEVQVDKNYRVVTSPAFMKEAKYSEVFDGIGKMIKELLKLC